VEAQKEAERIRDRDANIKDQRAKQAQKRQEAMWQELEKKEGASLVRNKSLVDPDAEFLGQSIDSTLEATPAEPAKISQTSSPSVSVG
jgi:transcription elongation GreA/GreB family factor